LHEYRQRLHVVPATDTSYSRLTNEELQRKTLELIKEMGQFFVRAQTKQDQAISLQQEHTMRTRSEEGKTEAWQRSTIALMESLREANSEYESQFKVDAILPRDEILSRLPKQSKNEQASHLYEHPTNLLGMKEVADDLERLAKSLSTR
ncbi:MAG: hypothetical protein NZM29_06750, partial [Nitrospira sp.]|nr:hypothetical protein [Nitrospira sp.]